MIRKLRKKFVLVNMLLVILVLVIVFATICISNYQMHVMQSYDALRLALHREEGGMPRFPVGKQQAPNQRFDKMLPVFTVTLDADGNLTYIDDGIVEVEDAFVQQAVEAALAVETEMGEIRALSLRFMKSENPFENKIAFLHTGVEQTAMVELVSTLLLVGMGGLAAFLIISIFLSAWALRPVQKAWAQQQQFVADASHELKTPLTVILANLGILQAHGEETVASQEQWIDNTRQEAVRMRRLVDSMLFLAKADATLPQPLQGEVSMSDVAWQGVLAFEPVAYEQGMTLQSDIAPDVYTLGDEGQLAQLVNILLDNACKYAGKDGNVSLALAQNQERITLAVENTGEHIPQEDLPHIFERFYRTDEARARTQGGYGLGLAIAAEIVKRHGGKIHATSTVAEGTCFTVTLPNVKARQKHHA